MESLKGFYVHLTIYLIVNAFIFGINMITSPKTYWFYWPLLGWGIGLLIHAVSVFLFEGFLGKDWEERKVKEYVRREKKRNK